tara:strand:+ start:101 stop:973 length:873 start_codon:yes stop_codon:yes gene_type:complete
MSARFLSIAALIVASILAPRPVSAADDARMLSCDGCTQQQVTLLAQRQYVNTYADIFVGDFSKGLLWQCWVIRETELGPRGSRNFASCSPAPVEANELFSDLAGIVYELNSSSIEIPYPGGNIHDIAGCPACARHWLYNNRHSASNQMSLVDLLAAQGYRIALALGLRGGQVEAAIQGRVLVKVYLSNDDSNGLERAYCLGRLSEIGLTIDSDSCVDSDGNPIPTTTNPDVPQAFLFTSTVNYSRMVTRLRATGRRVGTGTVDVMPIRVECTGNECQSEEQEDEHDESQE